MKTSVIGAGTWGTALAILLAHNGHEATLWTRSESTAEEMSVTRQHRHLPGAVLPDGLVVTSDMEKALIDKDLIVLAVPSVCIRETARRMTPMIRHGQVIVSVAKGIEADTLNTMSDVIEDEIPQADVAVLSGPSHAEEVSKFIPTTIVTGARSEKTAKFIQDTFMCDCFRVYINPDIKGIEIGGALKNVVALAAGMADGLGYGDNSKAALITRGIAEITRLGVKMGCDIETFQGLSGIGDLIVTCASMHSRNRRAGILIGSGKTYQEAMQEVGQVVEGVYAAKAARQLADKYGVSMPIVTEINEILFNNKSAEEAVNDLMLRDRRLENSGLKFDR
ncbi:NAD(P)H-dependent glycerol-3-phosphate dehydrogenase [Oribacterium sp. WCC10]|uniref:NAD(P)H-dependent glycerol-3-phosphate dehydrogenase n=1 Tax=Oribacterium sp. WCC10 TaxID=1855343 RepID=UPI0008E1D500|nr:NAD(P)H-dependent glycerol-3-phosphate dehydrogenase [Oribacterium sp. WCC10]SFG07686.1 glycerol-3-phosphate dehydrogenase (NAD(P)+) [Oribacterium sp. WCC10]